MRQRPPCAGLRLAEPGEFTERAFLNDKLDLAQAEAVSDLIEASTEAAARSASRSLSGAFSSEVERCASSSSTCACWWRPRSIFRKRRSTFSSAPKPASRLDAVGRRRWTRCWPSARSGALLREGMQVVLAGQPNVGKSSLLNALAGAELAIVTPIPGTTRDKVSETIQIEGVPVHMIDTAGLRDDAKRATRSSASASARSWAEIEGADAVVFLHDLTRMGQADYDAARGAN